MEVEIQAKGFELSETLRSHIGIQLQSTFKPSRRKVRKVIVRLFNVTNSHRRNIKSCRVQAVVIGLPHIITEYRGKNFYVAADTAIRRANRSVSKRLRKLNKFRRTFTPAPIGSLA